MQCHKLRTLSIQLPMGVVSSDWAVKVLTLESVTLIADEVKDFYPFFSCNPQLQNIYLTTAQNEDEIQENVKSDNMQIEKCCVGFQKLINQ